LTHDYATMGRIGGNRLAATHDMDAIAANARTGFLKRFDTQVDPDGTLSESERKRRSHHALQAYMAELSLKRKRKKQ
jgi:hypothetical protein